MRVLTRMKYGIYRLLGIVSPSGLYPGPYRDVECPPGCEEGCCGSLVVSYVDSCGRVTGPVIPDGIHSESELIPQKAVCGLCETVPFLGPSWPENCRTEGCERPC